MKSNNVIVSVVHLQEASRELMYVSPKLSSYLADLALSMLQTKNIDSIELKKIEELSNFIVDKK